MQTAKPGGGGFTTNSWGSFLTLWTFQQFRISFPTNAQTVDKDGQHPKHSKNIADNMEE